MVDPVPGGGYNLLEGGVAYTLQEPRFVDGFMSFPVVRKSMLSVGESAPGFELPNQDGDPIALSDYEGEKVIVYFYPRANTEGCTKEAHSFRDSWEELVDRGVNVIGISDDPVSDLKTFEGDHDLPFQLLSDEDGEVASQYDSYGEKNMFGNTFDGVFRNTYVIDEDGVITHVYENVSPEGHAQEILDDIGGRNTDIMQGTDNPQTTDGPDEPGSSDS